MEHNGGRDAARIIIAVVVVKRGGWARWLVGWWEEE